MTLFFIKMIVAVYNLNYEFFIVGKLKILKIVILLKMMVSQAEYRIQLNLIFINY